MVTSQKRHIRLIPCKRCQGKGAYSWTVRVSGKPVTKTGQCFRCHGNRLEYAAAQ